MAKENDTGVKAIEKARDKLRVEMKELQANLTEVEGQMADIQGEMQVKQRQIAALDQSIAVLRGEDHLQGLSDQIFNLIRDEGPMGVAKLAKLLPSIPKANIYEVLVSSRFTSVSRGLYDISERVYGGAREAGGGAESESA